MEKTINPKQKNPQETSNKEGAWGSWFLKTLQQKNYFFGAYGFSEDLNSKIIGVPVMLSTVLNLFSR